MEKMIKRVIAYIDQHLAEELNLTTLATKFGYSPQHFQAIFRKEFGVAPATYIRSRKLYYGLCLFSESKRSWQQIFPDIGFQSYAGFYKAFIKEFGCSPEIYRHLYHKKTQKSRCLENSFMRYRKSEIRQLLRNWSLSGEIQLQELQGQGKNAESIWQINEEYLLKIVFNENVLQQELYLGELFEGRQFMGKKPVLTKKGQLFYQTAGRFCLLTNYIPGETFTASDFIQDAAAIKEVGKGIAELQQIFAEAVPAVAVQRTAFERELIDWALPLLKKQVIQWQLPLPMDFLASYQNQLLAKIAELPQQLIHRDIHLDNILFKQNQLVSFIDFDLNQWNIRLFDICYFSTSVLSQLAPEDFADWIKKLPLLFTSYHERTPFTNAEKPAIFHVMFGIQMICTVYFNDSSDVTLKKLAQKNREVLVYLYNSRQQIEEMANGLINKN